MNAPANAPAAMDRSAPKRHARLSAARQRPRPDAENFGGEVSSEPPSRLTSLDHLVGAGEQRCWHIQAERLRGLEVDGQLELGWRLYWEFRRLIASENTIDVVGCAPVRVNRIRPIGDQAAGADEDAEWIDDGQSVPGGQRDDQIAMNYSPRI